MKKPHHIVDREAAVAAAAVEQFAKENGQILLPLMELVTQARMAVDKVIDRIGRQTIETILTLSAEPVAGPRTPGKSSGDIREGVPGLVEGRGRLSFMLRRFL